MEPRLPQLYTLSTKSVDNLIEDLQLRIDDAKIYFAVDPYEIFEFCFPVDPKKLRSVNIDQVADDQAALYEVFFVYKNKPVLLKEYAYELNTLLNYVYSRAETIYSKSELIDTIIREAKLREIPSEWDESWVELPEKIKEEFNVILAVALGIDSLGAERLRDIVGRRLLIEHLDVDKPEITGILESYSETSLSQIIYKKLSDDIAAKGDIITSVEKAKMLRTAQVDARVVDRLIYMNNALDKLHHDGRLSPRIILLYLSNAQRSAKIFGIPEVMNALPTIRDKKYQFWRTRSQILAYTLLKAHREENGKQDIKDGIQESIRKLEDFKNLLDEIKRGLDRPSSPALEDCPQCILEGGSGESCRYRELCGKIRDHQKMTREKLEITKNLDLMKALGDYQSLLDKKPEEKYRTYIELLQRIQKSGYEKIAIREMRHLPYILFVSSRLTNIMLEGLKPIPLDDPRRTGRDQVTAAAQYLPLKLELESDAYQEILKLIIEYFLTPVKQQVEKTQVIDIAYGKFVEIDAHLMKFDPEHELVRCLLFLAFPGVEADEMAFNHAKKTMLERIQETQNSIRREFLYIICWAARRMKHYDVADQYLSSALKEFGNDGRFYHGRSLNIYSWLTDEVTRLQCPYSWPQAIEDSKKAIELYSQQLGRYRELVGACNNNLAYFWALLSETVLLGTDEMKTYLKEARDALNRLEAHVDKGTWNPYYPEYFHTEAFVEHKEYLQMLQQGEKKESLMAKLENAKRAIQIAFDLYPKKRYKELDVEIQSALDYHMKRSSRVNA